MRTPSPAWRVTLGFATVYLVWGSTYLAIRYAIGSIPPFLMAGARFLVAGACLALWAALRGAPLPTRREWRAAGIAGGLMLVCGNGAVVWAEQKVPSGITSLLVALVPAWTVVAEWLLPRGRTPGRLTLLGLLLGLGGTALLATRGALTGGTISWPAMVLILGSLSWALGSIYLHRGPPQPASSAMAAGMQMLCGGAALILLFALTPGAGSFRLAEVTSRSLLSVGYLVVFGSLVTYSAYVWLLKVSTPARVSTYAFVNPVVALALGWGVAGEALDLQDAWAALLIVGAVAIITWDHAHPAQASS